MSDGSRHSAYIIEESTYGTTPSNPQWLPLRLKSISLGLKKNTVESEEIRSDRQIVDFRHGTHQVGGDIEVELAYDKNKWLLEGALCGSAVPQRTTGVTSLAATATTFTRSAGSFVTDGFVTGQVVIAAGFATAGNNGRFRVTNVAAGTLTVTALDGQTMAIEAAGGNEIIISERATIKAGTTRKSYSIERIFDDQTGNKYHRYDGVEFSGLKISVTPDKIASVSLSTVGQGSSLGSAILSGATYQTAQTTTPMVAFNATIQEGGGAIASVTEISLTIENGHEARYVVGSTETLRPSIGRSKVSGQITVYFDDSTMLQKFIDETESSLSFELFDPVGNSYAFTIGKLKYTGGQPDVKGEGPITLSMPFQALYNSADATAIKVEVKPVVTP